MNYRIFNTAAAAVLALGTQTAWAQNSTPQVIVDRSPIVFQGQPPVEQGGRILVPLRGVLEKLGAFVAFDSKTQTVTAFRGATRITLVIGSRNALVSDKAVTLDTPAQLINGATLVPLRFVAESLGAQVRYDVGSNTISIDSGANVAGGTPAATPPVPLPPPAPAPVSATAGVVTAIYRDTNPARIVLRVPDVTAAGDAREKTIPLKANAAYTLRRTNGTTRPVEIGRIRVGDEVSIVQTGDGMGSAVTITASTGSPTNAPKPAPPATPAVASTFKGEFLEYTKNGENYKLKMTDGREVELDKDAPILYDNQHISVDDLRSGDNVTVSVDPKSKMGTRVVIGAE